MAAMKENKTQRKQSEDKRVFLWLRDGRVIHPNAQTLIFIMIRPTPQNPIDRPIANETARRRNVKMSNRLVGHYPRSSPVHIRRPSAVVEVPTAAYARAYVIPTRIVDILQMHSGDGEAAVGGVADRGNISGCAGDGDVVVRVGCSQFDALPQTSSQRLEV